MKINAFNMEWDTTMNGRIIHSEHPNHYYDDSCVAYDEKSNCVLLNTEWAPKIIEYKGQRYDSYYKTGLIRSTESFGYGLFKADIVLPKGTSLWPAFWLTCTDHWPPEIDIVEAWSSRTEKSYRKNILKYDAGSQVHYGDCAWNHMQTKRKTMWRCLPDPQEEMVEYSCLWTPDEVRVSANGIAIMNCVNRKAMKYLRDARMNVVFDVFVQDGSVGWMSMDSPMVIKDFSYEPMEE